METAVADISGARGRRWVLLEMGVDLVGSDEVWLESGLIRKVVRLTGAVPSGRRRGSLALGLGFDSLVLAVRAVVSAWSGPFLAASPWTAVWLRLLGRRDLAVTNLAARPGTRSHRVLFRLLRQIPLVTMSAAEAEQWKALGGRALSVEYGNTFGYAPRGDSEGPPVKVFVGGSSDRDVGMISSLEAEIRASTVPVELTVADGSPRSTWSTEMSRVIRPGYVDAETFGSLISNSDIVLLPLEESDRSAGHMVLVGSLEAGVPVLTTATRGIREYIDGRWVRSLDRRLPILPQITGFAAETRTSAAEIRNHWVTRYSQQAYVDRVGNALAKLLITAEE